MPSCARTTYGVAASACWRTSRRSRWPSRRSPSMPKRPAVILQPVRLDREKHLPTPTLRDDDPIDLQIHTVYSDGQWQPDQLFDYLRAEGFRAVSITDQDTLEHVEELVALGAEHKIIVIPGVEVTTSWRGLSAHLLC